jgi:putative exporter of polyketide antibiotics
MKTLSLVFWALIVSAIGLAIAASPVEAAKKKSRPHSSVTAHAMAPGGTTAAFQGGVMAGPLYNGQDYLGDDPDPNIRAYLLRDLSGRYGGGR